MGLDSGTDNTALNPNELLANDGRLIPLAVKDNKLVVDMHEIPLGEIRKLIQPGKEMSRSAPTAQQVADKYDDMGWQLQLGDLILKGYKNKESGTHSLIITDSTGKPCAAIDTFFLLMLAKQYRLSGVENKPLNPYELLTKNGELVSLSVRDSKLVVNGHELSLDRINSWIQPGTRISDDAPTAQQVADEYDDMGWQLQLGDLILKGYKRKNLHGATMYFLIITDSTGKPRAELNSAYLLNMG